MGRPARIRTGSAGSLHRQGAGTVGSALATVAIVAGLPQLPVSGAAASGPPEPGIVDVTASLGFQGLDTLGTGMVIDRSGEVVTNNHVIRGETSIRVADLDNGRTYSAGVVGYDVSADVAVLRLEHASGLQPVTIGDSSQAKAGEAVTTIGNAGGNGGTPARTSGEVVALDQSITALDDNGNLEQLSGLIEVSAPLKPGDSGGALVDAAGQVIGMDTAGSGQFRFQQSSNDGFAIPINRALSIARQIEQGRPSATVHVGKTAFIGVDIESPAHRAGARALGALVTSVLPGAPASRAGIVPGDIIYAIEGRTVASPEALTGKLSNMRPGATGPARLDRPGGQESSGERAARERPTAVAAGLDRASAVSCQGRSPGGVRAQRRVCGDPRRRRSLSAAPPGARKLLSRRWRGSSSPTRPGVRRRRRSTCTCRSWARFAPRLLPGSPTGVTRRSTSRPAASPPRRSRTRTAFSRSRSTSSTTSSRCGRATVGSTRSGSSRGRWPTSTPSCWACSSGDGFPVEISAGPGDVPDGIPFAEDVVHRSYEPVWAHRFWRVLVSLDQVLKEHRARFRGKTSPVQLWWGSFDLAYSRFSGRLEDSEQWAAGFWPGRRARSAGGVLRLHLAQAGRDRGRGSRAGAGLLEPRAGRVPAPLRRGAGVARPAPQLALVPRVDLSGRRRARRLGPGTRARRRAGLARSHSGARSAASSAEPPARRRRPRSGASIGAQPALNRRRATERPLLVGLRK